jgi:hypothetical protein
MSMHQAGFAFLETEEDECTHCDQRHGFPAER